MVTGFLYVWALHYISFFVCLILYFKNKKNREQEEPERKRRSLGFLIPFGLLLAYLLIRFFSGWKITGWYPEAILVLGLFVYFDIDILANDRYSKKVFTAFLWIRSIYISSMAVRVVLAILLVVLAWHPENSVLPLDRSHDVKVYNNVFVYYNTKDYVLKYKNDLFEKDLLKIDCIPTISGIGSPNTHPIGAITVKGNDILFWNGYREEAGILVTPLPDNRLEIRGLNGFGSDASGNNRKQEICLDTLIRY